MRGALALAVSLFIAGCGPTEREKELFQRNLADREAAKAKIEAGEFDFNGATRVSTHCSNGVEYVVFSHVFTGYNKGGAGVGSSPSFNPDGTLRTCEVAE